MANTSIGKRLNRGSSLGTTRTSIAFPEDTLELIREVATRKVRSQSELILQAVEIGLRQLAKEKFPKKTGHLTRDEIGFILESIR